jgi:hypothetical protein
MKILDCESIDSAFASIEQILRIERSRLEELPGNLDLHVACRFSLDAQVGTPRFR